MEKCTLFLNTDSFYSGIFLRGSLEMEYSTSVQAYLVEDLAQNAEGYEEFIKLNAWKPILRRVSKQNALFQAFFSIFNTIHCIYNIKYHDR